MNLSYHGVDPQSQGSFSGGFGLDFLGFLSPPATTTTSHSLNSRIPALISTYERNTIDLRRHATEIFRHGATDECLWR